MSKTVSSHSVWQSERQWCHRNVRKTWSAARFSVYWGYRGKSISPGMNFSPGSHLSNSVQSRILLKPNRPRYCITHIKSTSHMWRYTVQKIKTYTQKESFIILHCSQRRIRDTWMDSEHQMKLAATGRSPANVLVLLLFLLFFLKLHPRCCNRQLAHQRRSGWHSWHWPACQRGTDVSLHITPGTRS